MYDKYKSVTVSIIVTVLFAVLIVAACVLLPFLTDRYLMLSSAPAEQLSSIKTALLVCLYCSAASALTLVYFLLRILFNVKKRVIFDEKNIAYLRYISWCCFFAAASFFALGFFKIFAFAVAFALVFVGLILRVTKNLLREATDIKKENDLVV